jgi:outer membrane lipase/esterase
MRLRMAWAIVAGGLTLLVSGPAMAQSTSVGDQGLNTVVSRLLSNNCAQLAGAAGPYGSQLAAICAVPTTGGASSSGGTATGESRISAIGEELRVYRRTRERREGASSDAGRGFGLFVATDYERFDKDNTRFETGFERDTVGGTLGIDYVFNPLVLLGVAINYAHEFGNYDAVGGGFDHDRYGLALYTSLSPIPRTFVDLVAGYTYKDYSFDRRASVVMPTDRTFSIAGETHGETNGDEFRLSAYGGYDFVFGKVTVGPRLGVTYRDTTIDGFRESGNTGLELAYDNQNTVSLTINPGVYGAIAISTGLGVIVPQATVEYVHEFMDDQRSVGFRFVQDLGGRKFRYQTDPPDRDYMNLALGVSMIFPGGTTGFVNFRELVAYRDRSSHAVTLGVRFAF